MKQLLFALFILGLTISACNKAKVDESRFMKAYEEILVVRETERDSAKAMKEIEAALKKNGYDKFSFAKDMQTLSMDKERFVKTIDSLRKRILSKEFIRELDKKIMAADTSNHSSTIKK